MNIFCLLRERAHDLPESERKLAEYILANPDRAVLMTAVELGRAAGSSSAAVIRLIRKLDCASLTEFRAHLSRTTPDLPRTCDSILIEADDTLDTISARLTRLVGDTLTDTLGMLDQTCLAEAADRIEGAGRIILIGVGISGLVAEDLYQKLIRIGYPAQYYVDSHTAILLADSTTAGDVLIAFSYSGETELPRRAVACARERGAFCIAVSRARKNSLAAEADLHFAIPGNEGEIRLGTIGSRYGELIVSDLLFMELARRRLPDTEASLRRTKTLVHGL